MNILKLHNEPKCLSGYELRLALPANAYCYALNVIKGRWLEGEEIIKTDPEWWRMYCEHFQIT